MRPKWNRESSNSLPICSSSTFCVRKYEECHDSSETADQAYTDSYSRSLQGTKWFHILFGNVLTLSIPVSFIWAE